MQVDLGNGKPSPTWQTVKLDDGQTFEVLVKPPTFREKMVDLGARAWGGDNEEAAAARATYRLRTAIADWRGLFVADEGADPPQKPLEFSWENLELIGTKYPAALDWMFIHAHRAFEGTLTEEASGNSGRPSATSSPSANGPESPTKAAEKPTK